MHASDTTLFYKSLGDFVRQRRRKLQFTQAALAAKLAMSRASIANIETGRQKLLVHQLHQLAVALGLPAVDLLTAGIGESEDRDIANIPLPKDLTPKQKAQISRLFSDKTSPPPGKKE
jgi:transcriptional regulator with XRE-family HTH domain